MLCLFLLLISLHFGCFVLLRYNQFLRCLGKQNYQLKAMGYENQAALDDSQASNARTSGVLGAIGAGLSAYGSYLKMGSSIPSFGTSGLDQHFFGHGTGGD